MATVSRIPEWQTQNSASTSTASASQSTVMPTDSNFMKAKGSELNCRGL